MILKGKNRRQRLQKGKGKVSTTNTIKLLCRLYSPHGNDSVLFVAKGEQIQNEEWRTVETSIPNLTRREKTTTNLFKRAEVASDRLR